MSPLQLARLIAFTAFVRPLSRIWPKDKASIAFVPREGTRYIDNVAHFYEWLRIHGVLPPGAYLLVTEPEVAKAWKARGRQVEFYDPLRPDQLLRYLRTACIVADSWQWIAEERYACFFGAKKVQIWHGIPLKQIEKSNLQRTLHRGWEGLVQAVAYWMKGRYPIYDLVVSTSEFFERWAFRPSFEAHRFANTGYPRNDYLCHSDDASLPDVDRDERVLRQIDALRREGKRVVVYAPTFRDTGGGPFVDGALDLTRLRDFAEANGLVFVVKLHPYVQEAPAAYLEPHILVYDASKDSAPLLRASDLLITDYSSISFDYLLLDRPLVFFPYDDEKYSRQDRSFLFDYDEYTPGPKCFDQAGLERAVVAELESPAAEWALRRAELERKCFTVPDGGASLRLWAEIERMLGDER